MGYFGRNNPRTPIAKLKLEHAETGFLYTDFAHGGHVPYAVNAPLHWPAFPNDASLDHRYHQEHCSWVSHYWHFKMLEDKFLTLFAESM